MSGSLAALVTVRGRRAWLLLCALLVLVFAATPAVAQQVVINTATVSPPDGVVDPDTDNNEATDETPIVQVATSKSSSPASGEAVSVGQTITYTLAVEVSGGPLPTDVVLTDTIGPGQTLDAGSLPSGCSSSTGGGGETIVTCTVPADSAAGTYTFEYSTTVDVDATDSVSNSVEPNVGTCDDCETDHPLAPPAVTYAKTADTTGPVSVGDEITYTVTVTVANSQLTADLVVTDTLGTGLAFGAVQGNSAEFACTGGLECTLPAGTVPGTYTVSYTAVVTDAAVGTVRNAVVAQGGNDDPSGPPPSCAGECEVVTPVAAPVVTYGKAADTTGPVSVGDEITYTVTVTVANSQLTADLVVTDTLGTGLAFGAVQGNSAEFACTGGLECTLPAGTVPGTYTVSYTAVVTDAAVGTVRNAVVAQGGNDDPSGPPPSCAGECEVVTPVAAPVVTYGKAADTTGPVSVGDEITYTVTVTVANSQLTADLVVTDTLGTGLAFGAVEGSSAEFACTGGLECTLPAGTVPGTYTVSYTAVVTDAAVGTVRNAVVAQGGNDDPSGPPPSCAGECEVVTPVAAPVVTYGKAADTTGPVSVGDEITYTVTVTVANSQLTADLVVTDTLGTGLAFGAVEGSSAEFACTGGLECTLPAGTVPGTYTVSYTAVVTDAAVGTVRNAVVAQGGNDDPSGPPPSCAGECEVVTPVAAPTVTVVKSSDPASGEMVLAGQTVTYTLTIQIERSALAQDLVLTDTFSGGQALAGDLPDECAATEAGLTCTFPAGTAPGEYTFSYATVVEAGASGTIGNVVVAAGGGDEDPVCNVCSTEHPVGVPAIEAVKTATLTVDNRTPGVGNVGDVVTYTITVTNVGNVTIDGLIVTDSFNGGEAVTLTCAPAQLAPGESATCESYSHTITVEDTNVEDGLLRNMVIATATATGGTAPPVTVTVTSESEAVVEVEQDVTTVRIVKQASPRDVRVGDLVRYTVVMENTGSYDLVNGTLVDMPPAGFTYVDGSLTVADRDGAGVVVGRYPVIRVEGLDIAAGETATVTYLLRVGAGVRAGIHTNSAVVEDGGEVISNVATADVQLVADPLLDESLIIGTVFNDRDGDGWQDSATMTGVHVQGGFAPGAYVANSTTVDRGNGPRPEPDASSPLLHGIGIGTIEGRQSEADPVERHQVVVSQLLTAPEFTDDFVLTTKEGITVRMDAEGNTRVERNGDAARGLTAAEPVVERRISKVEGGYRVDYVIGNAGIDERGIPGVRIASVEGLIVETDQFGRYHLVGIEGGLWERGRNFILKVDPATLPPGSEFTTDNPLVRRITPGLPVRFDFGVRLPSGLVEGGSKDVELELGEVLFAPGSAEVRQQYMPVIEAMAEKVRQYGGGEVVIEATAGNEALAFDRATAVRDALLSRLDGKLAKALRVSTRTQQDDPDSLVIGVDEGGLLLGAVMFDTDSSNIRPEFEPLLDRVAQALEKMGSGSIAIVGHTDMRASYEYNAKLGMRRAQAVFDALVKRLSPEVRARIRVDISNDPKAPVDGRK